MSYFKSIHFLAFALVMVLALTTAACGFRPIHGPGGNDQARHVLAGVDIAPIDDRVGQILYNRLLDRLNPKGRPIDPLYRLETNLDESIEQVGFQKNEFATRANLRLRARYSLQSLETGRAALSNLGSVVASYNILRSDFATLASENEARKRAARELADEIVNRLNIYFASNPAATSRAGAP